MDITGKLIDWTERGFVPDFLMRAGIRRLLKNRISDVDQGDCERNQEYLESLLEEFESGPIAPLSDKANEQHYEVPADFFSLVLGPRRKYSSCFYPDGVVGLEQAEVAALQTTCQRAEIEDGQQILELGCGWGSLTLWMAQHYPNANITAVSNSNSQREFIQQQAKQLGCDRNLQVITCDMNDFEIQQQFDRVVSVEMFEHMRNHRRLMRQVSNWLVPDGKLFVHIFCHRNLTYKFEDRSSGDWMSRYFFSGGIMPSDGLLHRYQDEMGLEHQWRWNGTHYHRTCEHWLQNMNHNRSAILELFETTYGPSDSVRWFHRWRMFFMACSELFATDKGNQWWVSHYLFQNNCSRSVDRRIENLMQSVP